MQALPIKIMLPRFGFIDIARGWAILLVVIGHAIQYSVSNFDECIGFRFIYAVHIPLFMFISGYVTRQSVSRRLCAGLRIKAQQLLLPFIFWLPISFFAIGWLQRPDGFVADFPIFVFQIIKNPDAGGLWFLLVLFECHLLFQAATVVSSRSAMLLGVLTLLALNALLVLWPASNWLGVGLLRWQFLFFLLGIAASKVGWQPPARGQSWLLFIVFITLVSFWYRKSAVPVDLWLPHLSTGAKKFAVQGYHAITAVIGIVATLGICAALEHSAVLNGFRSLLDRLGQVSLEVYVGHYLFLYMALRFSDAGSLNAGAQIFFVATVALLGAWALAYVVSMRPLARMLFYGR